MGCIKGGFGIVALVKERSERYGKKLLDVRNDLVFKAIFGEERNKSLLLMLLNSILTEEVEEIVFLDSNLGAEYVDEKYSILDIRVRTSENMEIDVEMQLDYHAGFENRMLMYWARMYIGQLKSGDSYSQLKKTVQISIANFKFLQNEHFHSTFHLLEKNGRIKFTDHLELHVLELPKVKLFEQLKDQDDLTKWMLFLSGDDKMKGELAMADMGIEKAYAELNRVSEDEVMRERAIARDKWLWDQATRREQAVIEGRKEGKEEAKEEIILSMYNEGLSVEMIARIMKVSDEKVQSIIKS